VKGELGWGSMIWVQERVILRLSLLKVVFV
jgi:hypothetical protein